MELCIGDVSEPEEIKIRNSLAVTGNPEMVETTCFSLWGIRDYSDSEI